MAGIAHGLGRPLLIIAEGDFVSPADYRDLAKHYSSAQDAIDRVEAWLAAIADSVARSKTQGRSQSSLRLTTDLKINIGAYVAEEEEALLVDNYFVETAAYRDALNGKSTIFVGRKGSGKTANLLKLRSVLERERRNLVVTIKPVSYELASLLELMGQLQQRGERGHVMENLWAYMVCTEIARTLVEKLREYEPSTLDEGESALLSFAQTAESLLKESFSVRFDRCVQQLAREIGALEDRGAEIREGVLSEALHLSLFSELRRHLRSAFERGWRVFVLIDNLDKAWDKSADIDKLAPSLLSLFGIVNNLRREFMADPRGPRLEVFAISVFVRADIFDYVLSHAREPDKIPFSVIRWDDGELLLRVVEERFLSFRPGAQVDDLWTKYFSEAIDGTPTRQYILSIIQPRPRDLLYLMSKAIEFAVNRRHPRVLPDDLKAAERDYSQFAFRSAMVENGVSIDKLEDVLIELAGGSATVDASAIEKAVAKVGLPADKSADVLQHLVKLGILGLQQPNGDFWWANDDAGELKKHLSMAARSGNQNEQKYRIGRAYQPYLEVFS